MKEMQAHARKIRFLDAAECLVLSNLVTEERRQLFGRIAEHLNSLALEIETEAKTTLIDEPSATPDQHVNLADAPRSFTQPSASRAFMATASLPVIACRNDSYCRSGHMGTEPHRIRFRKLGGKSRVGVPGVSSRVRDAAAEERGQRKAFNDQLNALIARLNHVAKDLDDLKSLRAGVSAAPSTKGGVSQEDTRLLARKPNLSLRKK